MSDLIRFDRLGPLGLVTLDRPQALNAMTLPMFLAFDAGLAAWADDPAVAVVVVRGAGTAFCAGGDVVDVARAGRAVRDGLGDDTPIHRMFAAEYRLDHRTRRFPKPYVALLDGLTLGGGVGLSQHGSHRVVTENTRWAMPETAIGFCPDVGMTHVLPRLPGHVGLWLGLTGARLEAADLLHLGLASGFVPSAGLDTLVEALAAADWGGAPGPAVVDRVLANHALTLRRPPPILPHLDAIARCFAGASVEAILTALEREDTDWARAQHALLSDRSPTALKVTLRALHRGARLSFEACLDAEYRLSVTLGRTDDFLEGVRAALIDKDKTPRWTPPTLAAVDETDLARLLSAGPEEGLGLSETLLVTADGASGRWRDTMD